MKTKKTSTAIVLPETQPKPRKEDVLNALVERAREQHTKEAAALKDKEEAAIKAVEDEAKRIFMEEMPTLVPSFDLPWRHSSTKSVSVTFKVTGQRLQKLLQAYYASPSLRPFDPAAVKKKLREKLQPSGDRVAALLNNPEAVKALDAMLKQLA